MRVTPIDTKTRKCATRFRKFSTYYQLCFDSHTAGRLAKPTRALRLPTAPWAISKLYPYLQFSRTMSYYFRQWQLSEVSAQETCGQFETPCTTSYDHYRIHPNLRLSLQTMCLPLCRRIAQAPQGVVLLPRCRALVGPCLNLRLIRELF